MTYVFILLGILAGSLGGYFYASYLGKETLRRLTPADDSEDILKEAREQEKSLLEREQIQSQKTLETRKNQDDEKFRLFSEGLKLQETEINGRQSEIDKRENEINLSQEKLKQKEQEIANKYKEKESLLELSQNTLLEYREFLAQKAQTTIIDTKQQISQSILEHEQLQLSKNAIDAAEHLKEIAPKKALEVLQNVESKYNPFFIWPKQSFSVSLPKKNYENLILPQSSFVQALVEETGIQLEALPEGDDGIFVKISGGFGVDKEILRLSLEQMGSNLITDINRIKTIKTANSRLVQMNLHKMAKEASRILKLDGLHSELLKLVASLNYRTSHRQNQYYHSLEVAILAGLLANELGLDASFAKRTGILHDIGKALDYRIEGSHAVISADYASQYGESQDIVDTVLSHHDDKILETPYAYILKAADALSGARPGARLEMEDGYQRRIDTISEAIHSFSHQGVLSSAIMYAGREVHVFVDNEKVKEHDIQPLAHSIARKLEAEVEYPGQIRVTIVRRTEVTEVA